METINKNIQNNIYNNKISRNQVKKIFLKKGIVCFNEKTFLDVTSSDKFDTKYFSSRFLVFISLYHKEFDINYVNILNSEPIDELSDEAHRVYKSYSRFVYYRDRENDCLKLPDKYYNELKNKYNALGEVLPDYVPCDEMTFELRAFIKFFDTAYKYILFETLKTGCITSWFYNLIDLKFNADKKYIIED